MRVEWLHTVLINTDDGGAWGKLCEGEASMFESYSEPSK